MLAAAKQEIRSKLEVIMCETKLINKITAPCVYKC